MTAAGTPAQAARAFGVVFGGPLVLDVAAAAAAAATARAVRERRRPPVPAVLGTLAAGAYFTGGRHWMHHWGATCEEPMTHAVEIDAPPEEVWPWLAQIGQDRGGFYSYEWLENLAGCEMRNAGEIHPEWQHREPGEKVMLHPAIGLPVSRFEPGRALALEGWGSFELEPLDGGCRTRLVARGEPARGASALFYALLVEIPHFVMEREMLLGIKRRAEGAGP